MHDAVEKFLTSETYAVAGASNKREKFGNRVFRTLIESGRSTYPLNPAASEIEGHAAYASIVDLPVVPGALSIITPPKVTRKIVAAAIAAGIKNIWIQPGAQDEIASQSARDAGINIIDDGSCILFILAQQN